MKFLRWLFFNGSIAILWISFAIGVWFGLQYLKSFNQHMPGCLVLLIALSFAEVIVSVLHWNKKPWSCVKCMCGWLALLLAFLFHTEYWYFYLPLGYLVGKIYSGILMRWL